jgi:uncharacterized membrane protein
LKKWLIFCLVLVVFGLMDCVTTVVGITCFGATEKNPLLASITETNLLAFSVIKLAAVTLTGILFYKAGRIEKPEGSKLQTGSRFLQLTYSLSLLTLATVVTNNMMVVARLV